MEDARLRKQPHTAQIRTWARGALYTIAEREGRSVSEVISEALEGWLHAHYPDCIPEDLRKKE